MSGYMTLLGAEDVRSAGNRISEASDRMVSAAQSIEESVTRLERMLVEFSEDMRALSDD